MAEGGVIEREVFKVHVGIARDPREDHHLPEVDKVQLWHGRIFFYQLCHLFVRAFILILGKAFRQLAHVFHGDLPSVGFAVYAACDVAQLAVGKAYERVGHNSYLCCLGHVHGEVLQLWQRAVDLGLGLEDEASPQTDDGEARRLVSSARVDVKRQLGLHTCERGLCSYDLFGEVCNLCPCVW